jgi:hypothetical protein
VAAHELGDVVRDDRTLTLQVPGDGSPRSLRLSLTLVMTGFACAYIAMSIPRNNTSRGTVLLIGAALAFFEPWVGLLFGILVTLVLVGWDRNPDPIPHED